jgi:hypothetical protein
MRRFLAFLPVSLVLAACGGGSGGGGAPAGGGKTTGTDQMQSPAGQTTVKAPGY